MFDSYDAHDRVVIDHAVDDPVSAASRGAITGELRLERLADPLGVFEERADEELHDRDGYSFGQARKSALG